MTIPNKIDQPLSYWARGKRRNIIFLASFLGLYTLFHILYFTVSDNDLRQFYQDYLVSLCVHIINYWTPEEQVRGVNNALVSSRAALEVVRGCDGAGVLFIVMAATLAYVCPLRNKLLGVVSGILLVYGFNLIRIISLYYIVSYRPDWFLATHTLYAPTLMIILSCLFFAWWASYSRSSCQS